MAAPYSYAPQQQHQHQHQQPAPQAGAQPPARTFDLDDLLGPPTAPPQQAASQPQPQPQPQVLPQAPAAPPPPPPPGAPNDDPFGFMAPPAQQQQQQQQPVPAAQPAATYQQPQQPAAYPSTYEAQAQQAPQPPQPQAAPYTVPQAAHPPQPQVQPQPQVHMQPQPPQPQVQAQPQPPQPQAQQVNAAAYQYPTPPGQQPAGYAAPSQAPAPPPAQQPLPPQPQAQVQQPAALPPQQQQPAPQQPAAGMPRQDSTGYSGFLHQQQQPAPQPQAPSGGPQYGVPPSAVALPTAGAAHVAGATAPAGYGAPAHASPAPPQPQPPTSMYGQQQQPHQAAASVPDVAAYDEDRDRANLERIRKLREQLEREQAAEAAMHQGGGATGGTARAGGLASASTEGWPCPTCTFKNKNMSATECEVCSEPRAGYAKRPEVPSGSVQAGGGVPATQTATGHVIQAQTVSPPAPGGSADQVPAGMWSCPNCTLHNSSSNAKCEACDYARPGGAVAGAPQQTPGLDSRTGAASTGPSVPTVWNCPQCTFENAIAKMKCDMCEAERPPQITQLIELAQRYAASTTTTASSGGGASGVADLPLTVNGRRLTAEEQQRLVRQQEQLMRQIQNGGTADTRRSGGGQRRPPPPPADDDTDDDHDGDDAVQWQKDTDAKRCTKCDAGFGLMVRRHHCRACGFVFCKNCCNHFIKLKTGAAAKEERVCNDCYKERTAPARTPPARRGQQGSRRTNVGYPADVEPVGSRRSDGLAVDFL